MKLLLKRVTTGSGAKFSAKAEGCHEARVCGSGGNAIARERDYWLGRDPLGQAVKAVMKLKPLSLAMPLSLVSVTSCSDATSRPKALKTGLKLGSVSLAMKLSLVGVTTC